MATTNRRYAADTDVSGARSREEIEGTLRRYGGTGFGYIVDDTIPAAVIVFRLRERHYKLYVPLPKPTDDDIRYTPAKREVRSPDAQGRALEQAARVRWRAVALYVKATLEAVESGIISVESAFLAATLLPDGPGGGAVGRGADRRSLPRGPHAAGPAGDGSAAVGAG